MTRPRAAACTALLAAMLALTSGCVHYPSIIDVGGTRLLPERGRALRQAGGALFYVDINSTGKFGDELTRVSAAVARQARLVDAAGRPLITLAIPGTTVVSLRPGGPHAVLSDLTRELVAGETIIVTLSFTKTGNIGVITPVE